MEHLADSFGVSFFAAENISTIVKSAGVSVDAYWPSLFAKLFSKKSVEELIANVGARKFGGATKSIRRAVRPPWLLHYTPSLTKQLCTQYRLGPH